eukprot:4342627-Prymnesium_polylepis.1
MMRRVAVSGATRAPRCRGCTCVSPPPGRTPAHAALSRRPSSGRGRVAAARCDPTSRNSHP